MWAKGQRQLWHVKWGLGVRVRVRVRVADNQQPLPHCYGYCLRPLVRGLLLIIVYISRMQFFFSAPFKYSARGKVSIVFAFLLLFLLSLLLLPLLLLLLLLPVFICH